MWKELCGTKKEDVLTRQTRVLVRIVASGKLMVRQKKISTSKVERRLLG